MGKCNPDCNPALKTLRIGGFTGFTTIDYPDHLAAVVFCQGCPWRCGYCHNRHLCPTQPTQPGAMIPWHTLLTHLTKRQHLLDAVVFSGGEPTVQPYSLIAAIGDLKALGFKIGLHTAGIYPQALTRCLPLLDWVGLDIKTTPDRYTALTTNPHSGSRACQSLTALLDSSVDYEIRTTAHPDYLPLPVLTKLAHSLATQGVTHFTLQESNWPTPLPYATAEAYFKAATAQISHRFTHFKIRRL